MRRRVEEQDRGVQRVERRRRIMRTRSISSKYFIIITITAYSPLFFYSIHPSHLFKSGNTQMTLTSDNLSPLSHTHTPLSVHLHSHPSLSALPLSGCSPPPPLLLHHHISTFIKYYIIPTRFSKSIALHALSDEFSFKRVATSQSRCLK